MLLAAAASGYEAVIDVLAEAGVSLNATDEQTGRGVLELAAMNGHDSVTRTLFKKENQTQKFSDDNRIQTSRRLAAENGHGAALRALLESFGWDRKDALCAAARSGQRAVAEVLPEYDSFPVNKIHGYGSADERESPFLVAAHNGQVGTLELFKNYVQWVDNPRSRREETALHVAAAAGQAQVVRWLVDNGADVNKTTSGGDTPLLLAVMGEDEVIVRILLEQGATVVNPTLSRRSREDILTCAAVLKDTAILELLLESMRGDPRSPPEMKHRDIVDASLKDAQRRQRNHIVEKLEQELKLYRERKIEESLGSNEA